VTYDNGNIVYGYQTDPRTTVSSSNPLVSASDGMSLSHPLAFTHTHTHTHTILVQNVNVGTIIASGDPSSQETAILTFSFSFTDITVQETLNIYIADSLVLDVNPYPAYSGSSSKSVSELRLIHHTNVYQRAQAKLTVSFSLASASDLLVTHYSNSAYSSSNENVLEMSAITSSINSYLVPSSAGVCTITGQFGSWLTSNTHEITVVSEYALISSMTLARSSNVVTGLLDSTHDDLTLRVEFDDGSIFENARTLSFISIDEYVEFNSSMISEVTIDNLGEMTLKNNSKSPTYVLVTAIPKVTSNPTSYVSLIGNLKPDAGDVDLGMTSTFMFPSITTSAMSNTYYVDVYLNTNGKYVETWKVYLYFDKTILKATGDFVNYITTGTLSASANVVGEEDRVTLAFSTTSQDLIGTYKLVASVGFTALAEGDAYLYPHIENIVEYNGGGYISRAVDGLAGSGFVIVGDTRRRRRRLWDSHPRPSSSTTRRLSTTCDEPVRDVFVFI